MQVTNLAYFYETSRKVRGGKWVWVKDSNGEQRGNVLLGGTILNPKKGFDHLYAAQLVQYTPAQGCLIFRSFKTKADIAANGTTIVIEGDGYSDAPEVGMYLMLAPNIGSDSIGVSSESELAVANDKVDLADATFVVSASGVKDYTGTYTKVTAVVYDETNEKFTLTVDTALSASKIDAGAILVEADAAADVALAGEATGACKVLVPNPNTFIEADRDLMPTEGFGIENADYSISTVYNKQAWIARMQPLPQYVLAKNRSYIDGIFWI